MKMGCVIFVSGVVSREKENVLNLTRELVPVVSISKMESPEFTLDAVFLREGVCPFTSIAVVNCVVEVSATWTVEVSPSSWMTVALSPCEYATVTVLQGSPSHPHVLAVSDPEGLT